MFSATRKKIACAILIICSSACGYHFTGSTGNLPPEIRTIAIPFFSNKTFEPRIENYFTNALIEEFLERGIVRIGKREESDAILVGIIKSFKISPISFDKNDRVVEYRATVILDTSLKRNDNDLILWESSGISGSHEYTVSSNITVTDTNEIEAVKKIAADLAEEIHNSIFEGF